MPPLLDKLGQPITPGYYLVYGHALGQSAALRIGKVLRLEAMPSTRFHQKQFEYRITVRGVNDDCYWVPPKLLTRASVIQFPERTVVVPLESLPLNIRELLEPVPILGDPDAA